MAFAVQRAVRSSHAARCSRSRVLVPAIKATAEPQGRPVALPSGTLWLLNAFQDAYYSVHGSGFIIPRVEEVEGHGVQAGIRPKFVRNKPLPAVRSPAPEPSSAGLIHQAVSAQPMALTIISDTPPVDVSVDETDEGDDVVDVMQVEELQAAAASPAANTTCTGIVHVPAESTDTEEDADVFESSSTSPRRNKMMRFTCLANGCHAVNIKPINMDSFNKGTLFAQCGKCGKWHLIKDHLHWFDQTVYDQYRPRAGQRPNPKAIPLESIPEALRPPPAGDEMDFFGGGRQVGGYEFDM